MMKNHTLAYITRGRVWRQRRGYMVTGMLLALACGLCCAMLMLGNTIYPVSDVLRALLGEQLKGVSFAVQTIRLPRMLAGIFAGFAFGMAGATFQTMLRNPLANPNVIGITSGSSAAAVFCIIILHASEAIVSVAAVLAGLATVLVIYALARGRTFSIGRLILVGIGMQAMFNSAITYLFLIGKQHDLPAAMRWLTGSLNGSRMDELPQLMITVLICAPIIMMLSKHLSMLELGELAATSLGVRTNHVRVLLMISAVVMVAIATAATGPIASVAFLAGPIARRLVGAGFASMIPAGLIGANLVLAADLIGQFAFEVRFPAGIITGIIGAPYLIYLLIRMSRRGDL